MGSLSQRKVRVAITIAGSDSSGGAGIEADLKTFSTMGVHGTAAITSVTAQNTQEVRGIYDLPPIAVRKQIEAVYDDIGIDAAKTGMLSNASIVKEVSSTLKQYDFPLVVDPVMVSKSNATLLSDDAVEVMIKEILPRATVVTPNIPEAERISGIKIKRVDDAKKAAKAISENYGSEAVVVKGGHMGGEQSVDVIYYKGQFKELSSKRINTSTDHGTGCSFSAAIASGLAKGHSILDSIKEAKEFINKAIYYGLKIGKGHGPVNPSSYVEVPAIKFHMIEEMDKAIELLLKEQQRIAKLVPEVSMNVAYSLPAKYARSVDDVIAIPGRIRPYGNKLVFDRYPRFGASSHVARALLKYMEYFPEYRAASNIAVDDAIIAAVDALGLLRSSYDRKQEPKDVKEKEGASLPWGVSEAIKNSGYKRVEVIIDSGDYGKEPGAMVFGKNPLEVVEKLIAIASRL